MVTPSLRLTLILHTMLETQFHISFPEQLKCFDAYRGLSYIPKLVYKELPNQGHNVGIFNKL